MIIQQEKTEASSAVRRLEAPPSVRFACAGVELRVKSGDTVRAGDLLARSAEGASLQRRLHSPLTGVVRIGDGQTVIVEGEWPSSSQPEDHHDPEQLEPDAITDRAREAGLVGMGGGAFPTYLKLGYGKPVDCVIVNGCEGEPYLCCDHRVLAEHRREVECGMRLAMRAVGATKGYIADSETDYIAGYERFLIEDRLGRSIPDGCLPVDVGVVVINVQTARALHRAVCCNEPLTERVITVAGAAVGRPGNYLMPFGTSVGHILNACDYDASLAERLVAGGPMMGREADLDSTVRAGTGGILALGKGEVAVVAEDPCIRCGRCIDACAVGLPVTELVQYPASDAVLRCIEGGVCQFVCRGRISLGPRLRAAKASYRLGQRQ